MTKQLPELKHRL